MTEPTGGSTLWSDSDNSAVAEYRSISIEAMVCLGCGLGSLSVFLTTWLLLLPIIAILVGLVGLARLARNPETLAGRPMIQVGLCVAIICLAASSLSDWFYWRDFRSQAADVANEYIEHIKANEPQLAMEYQSYPWSRTRTADPREAWKPYATGKIEAESLEPLTKGRGARTLMEYGDKADVRLYQWEDVYAVSTTEQGAVVYVVTLDDPRPGGEGKISYFLRLVLERARLKKQQAVGWRVVSISGPLKPEDIGAR